MSKNIIIKILAENQQHANNTKEFKFLRIIQNCQRYLCLQESMTTIDTQQMAVMNQMSLVIQKLYRQETPNQIHVFL